MLFIHLVYLQCMLGASGDELSAAIHWVIWSGILPVMIVMYEPCLQPESPLIVVSICISFSGLAIAYRCFLVACHKHFLKCFDIKHLR